MSLTFLSYVESLENRLENMEKLLQRVSLAVHIDIISLIPQKLCPDADFTQELGQRIDRESWSGDKRPLDIMPAGISRTTSPVRNIPRAPDSKPPIPVDLDDLQPSDDEMAHGTLAEGLKRLAVEPLDPRFLGKSSGAMLIRAAMNMKRELDGAPSTKSFHDLLPPQRRLEFWSPFAGVHRHLEQAEYRCRS